VATSQGYGSNGALLVLPVDFAEEGCLQRIRYKLENLYPAQKEFAVCQLLNDVSYSPTLPPRALPISPMRSACL
jgi:hypothetical protein